MFSVPHPPTRHPTHRKERNECGTRHTGGVMSSGQDPKIAIAVESHPSAKNALGWGTLGRGFV